MAQAYFSPGNACRDIIIDSIHKAIHSVKICVFTISDDLITKAILLKHHQGVKIKLLTDNDKCYDVGSDVELLCSKGIEVKVDKTPYHMHHKFLVIDDQLILTGSYNWTKSAADRNHENIIVSDDKQLIKAFTKEFNKLWEEMEEF